MLPKLFFTEGVYNINPPKDLDFDPLFEIVTSLVIKKNDGNVREFDLIKEKNNYYIISIKRSYQNRTLDILEMPIPSYLIQFAVLYKKSTERMNEIHMVYTTYNEEMFCLGDKITIKKKTKEDTYINKTSIIRYIKIKYINNQNQSRSSVLESMYSDLTKINESLQKLQEFKKSFLNEKTTFVSTVTQFVMGEKTVYMDDFEYSKVLRINNIINQFIQIRNKITNKIDKINQLGYIVDIYYSTEDNPTEIKLLNYWKDDCFIRYTTNNKVQ
jgi:hypothetical protein